MGIEGWYFDPNHGNCLRKIFKMTSKKYRIVGSYGDDQPPHSPGELWKATLVAKGNHLTVDFESKTVTHASRYDALFCPTRRLIRWQDGNTWIQMYGPAKM